MPSANKYRDRVRFQRRTGSEDGFGNTVGEWTDLFAARSAELLPLPMKTNVDPVTGRPQSVTFYNCKVRFDSDTRTVTTDDRVIDDHNPDRTFKIRSVLDLNGRRSELLIQLEQGGADG